MDENQSWSLWLVPEDEIYRSLSHTIARLADTYDAPRFEPHVTLLGILAGAEAHLLEQSARLAELMQPCPVQLSSPDHTEAYFQCLFLRVEPTAELLEAHRQAKRIFGRADLPTYEPHISLMYGSYPVETRQSIIARLGTELEGEFTAEHFHLYNTSGSPHSWRRVQTFAVL